MGVYTTYDGYGDDSVGVVFAVSMFDVLGASVFSGVDVRSFVFYLSSLFRFLFAL